MTHLIMILATGFYSGYIPKASGTCGSVVGIVLYLLFFKSLPATTYLSVLAGLLVIGFWVSGSAEKILDQKDPKQVVIDEIVGILITLIAIPPKLPILLLGFMLFRFFDILKPFPIRWIDQRIHGGIGIMLDDVIAGIFSWLVLRGTLLVF